MKKSLFPVDYKLRDTRKYLYRFPSHANYVRVSHSFANFHNATLLDLFTQFATTRKQLVIPIACFNLHRQRKITQQFFTWKIGKQIYALVPKEEIKPHEKQKYNEYLEDLAWNQ